MERINACILVAQESLVVPWGILVNVIMSRMGARMVRRKGSMRQRERNGHIEDLARIAGNPKFETQYILPDAQETSPVLEG